MTLAIPIGPPPQRPLHLQDRRGKLLLSEPRLMVPRMAPVNYALPISDHWATSKLGWFWIASSPSAVFLKGTRATGSKGVVAVTGTSNGIGLAFSGSYTDGQTPNFSGLPDMTNGITQFTVEASFIYTGTTAGSGRAIFTRYEYGMNFGFSHEYKKLSLNFRTSSGWKSYGIANHSLANYSNVFTTALITYRGGTDYSCWINGVKFTCTGADFSGSTGISMTTTLYIGAQWNGSETNTSSDVFRNMSCGFYPFGFSESQMQEKSLSPYEFLTPA